MSTDVSDGALADAGSVAGCAIFLDDSRARLLIRVYSNKLVQATGRDGESYDAPEDLVSVSRLPKPLARRSPRTGTHSLHSLPSFVLRTIPQLLFTSTCFVHGSYDL